MYTNEVKYGKSVSYQNPHDINSEKRLSQVNIYPVVGTNGYVESIVILNFDITEHKRAKFLLNHKY